MCDENLLTYQAILLDKIHSNNVLLRDIHRKHLRLIKDVTVRPGIVEYCKT